MLRPSNMWAIRIKVPNLVLVILSATSVVQCYHSNGSSLVEIFYGTVITQDYFKPKNEFSFAMTMTMTMTMTMMMIIIIIFIFLLWLLLKVTRSRSQGVHGNRHINISARNSQHDPVIHGTKHAFMKNGNTRQRKPLTFSLITS